MYVIRCWVFFKCITKNHIKKGDLMGEKGLYCLMYRTNTIIIIAKNKTIYLQHSSQTHKYKSSLIYRSSMQSICFIVQCNFFYLFLCFSLFLWKLAFFLCKLQHSRNLCQKNTNLYNLTNYIDLNISCCYFLCLTGFTCIAICNYPEPVWSFNSQGKREIKCRIPHVGPCRQLEFNSLLGEIY